MTDATTTVGDVKAALRDFARERDWEQFHNPKDLGVALSIEVGEILEHFRFRTGEEIGERLKDESFRGRLAHELADAASFIIRLADVTGIDLTAAIEKKMRVSAEKYPADTVRGKPHKYTHYTSEDER
ncbi:MAG: nucleotide pyrophosphohydrolase [Armatimonadota bacterium]|jgi:dCTP diphosphatase